MDEMSDPESTDAGETASDRGGFAASLRRWSQAVCAEEISGAEDLSERSERERVALLRRLPKAPTTERPTLQDPNAP